VTLVRGDRVDAVARLRHMRQRARARGASVVVAAMRSPAGKAVEALDATLREARGRDLSTAPSIWHSTATRRRRSARDAPEELLARIRRSSTKLRHDPSRPICSSPACSATGAIEAGARVAQAAQLWLAGELMLTRRRARARLAARLRG
jgi:hypothetical protein